MIVIVSLSLHDACVMALVVYIIAIATDATNQWQPQSSVSTFPDLTALREQHQVNSELVQGDLDILPKCLLMLLFFCLPLSGR